MSYDFDSLLQTFVDYHNEHLGNRPLDGVEDPSTIRRLVEVIDQSFEEMTDPDDKSTWENPTFTYEEGVFLWNEFVERGC